MLLRRFIPHENVPDNQVEKSQFYTKPDVIAGPELFATEPPHSATTRAVLSSDTEEFDHENQPEIFLPLQLETPPPIAVDELVHTTLPPPESHNETIVILPAVVPEGPQPELQPSPGEGKNQDIPTPDVTQPEASQV